MGERNLYQIAFSSFFCYFKGRCELLAAFIFHAVVLNSF